MCRRKHARREKKVSGNGHAIKEQKNRKRSPRNTRQSPEKPRGLMKGGVKTGLDRGRV